MRILPELKDTLPPRHIYGFYIRKTVDGFYNIVLERDGWIARLTSDNKLSFGGHFATLFDAIIFCQERKIIVCQFNSFEEFFQWKTSLL